MSIFGYNSVSCDRTRQKSLITVWAEARGNHDTAEAEWSFGCSSRGVAHLKNGYPMLCHGCILRMALSVVGVDGESPNEAIVSILIDGKLPSHNFIWKRPGEKVATLILTRPIEVAAGSTINFLSHMDCPARSSIVSLHIELDLYR